MINDKSADVFDNIDDYGEKFTGAKKDAGIEYETTPIALDATNVLSKRKLWARPDFKEDVRGGINSIKHALLFMQLYDNLSSKPLADGYFKISKKVWDESYELSINFLKDAYENGHYESLDKLKYEFHAFIRGKYPNSTKDLERYAAGVRSGSSVTHPFTLSLESKLKLLCLESLGWGVDQDVNDDDKYGACILNDSRTKKDAWYAVVSITAKRVRTLNNWVEYETFEEAMAQAKLIFDEQVLTPRRNTPKVIKERSKPPKRPCFDRPFIRIGPDLRKSELITIEHFVETFRFRGIEFGNWVTQSERQGFLDATYDALMDMCDIIGLPPSLASLGGTLGIAFGSRGKGADNVSAHFELDQWLIHLTKTKGVGSICHEWMHGLDAFLARRNKTNSDFFIDRFVWHEPHSRYRKSYNAISSNLQSTTGLRDQAMMGAYSEFLHKMIIADRESTKRSPTTFCLNAAELDLKSKKVYWGTPRELFARVGECWMSDRLKQEGRVNEFLVYGTEHSASAWNTQVSMFPEGSEREEIITAMDNWFKALATMWKSDT